MLDIAIGQRARVGQLALPQRLSHIKYWGVWYWCDKMKINSFFWQQSVLFLNVLLFKLDTTSPTIFQLLYAFQKIWFVIPSKIQSCFPLIFFVRLKTPTTQPSLEVWEQIIVAGSQVWKIRWMRKRLETQLMLFCLRNIRCVRWCIVIMKKNLFLLQMWPLLLDFINQSIQ